MQVSCSYLIIESRKMRAILGAGNFMYIFITTKTPLLNLEYFIAKRLITAKDYKSSISAPIIKILQFSATCNRNDHDDCFSSDRNWGYNRKGFVKKISAFNGHIIISKSMTITNRKLL